LDSAGSKRYNPKPRDTTKRADRAKINRQKLLILLLICLCVYMIISIISTEMSIYTQQKTLTELQTQISEQQTENDELSRIVEGDGVSEEYIERIAREKLGYAGVNEKVFVDAAGTDSGSSDDQQG
jgi:cell division protein DivIC